MTSRRRFLAIAGAVGLAGVAGAVAWRARRSAGLVNPCLGPLPDALAAHPLVREAWEGVDPALVLDSHVHLFGDGGPDSEAWFSDRAGTWRWPVAETQRRVFLNAACLEPGVGAGAEYLARLESLSADFPAGFAMVLLAFDAYHDAQGVRQDDSTQLYVANDYCARAAATRPGRCEWAASVHPYRADAVAELERVHRLGARAVKWIPAAQGIDPAAPRCDPFYEALARLDLPLITHAGQERALTGDQSLGNPLRLRRALEHGVRVVVAHCATMGRGRDLDVGPHGPWTDNFLLFTRLMDQAAYAGRLFGDLSAVTQRARAGDALRRIIERGSAGGDWEGRLLNGSDYPLPGILPLFSPDQLAGERLLDPAAAAALAAIRDHNPLLFDFVLKRSLSAGGRRLSPRVFEMRGFFTASPATPGA
ncbi:MAG TPA: amidohydrolase family protein [Gemmatimonadales bacterium]|nr:amidohydrolase family protein [Gemmatimonadales bacterium]